MPRRSYDFGRIYRRTLSAHNGCALVPHPAGIDEVPGRWAWSPRLGAPKRISIRRLSRSAESHLSRIYRNTPAADNRDAPTVKSMLVVGEVSGGSFRRLSLGAP
jgi:hypothetical protein